MSDSQLFASQGVGIPASSEPTASISTSDPASSLRAAALLTLKSKRRKAQPSSTLALPTRPPADTTFQLDYGTEESPSVPRLRSPPKAVDPPKPSPPPETQTREEGEISDEESAAPVLPKPRSPALLQPLLDTNLRHPRDPTPSTSALPQQPALRTKPSLSQRISEAPNVSDTAALTQVNMLDHRQLDLNTASEDPHYLLDADHVRPGVALNQIQYDRAKDNVLDLLGWGVAPEYLVDCGLTREIVFYVFSELNLRLPQNLDTAGLIPYTPETPFLVERPKLALMPPPPSPQPLRSSDVHLCPSSPASAQRATLSPPIEMSPAPLPGTSPGPVTLTAVESPQVVITGNLHDMEQQRRQELLARKAVIASRKSKQVSISNVSLTSSGIPVSVPSFPSSSRQDVEMTVPTETVDDFLKTIGSSPKTGETSTGSSPLHQRPTDDMDVDEIPGLSGPRQYSATTSVPSRSNTCPAAPPNDLVSPTHSSHRPVSPNACLPSSTESTSTTFTEKSGSHTPSGTPALPEGPALQRRGAKRPVAADFVDFDSGSRPSISGNGGYTAGTHSGSRRRTGAGFANVTSARRFIIDLSDSEGECDGDVVMCDAGLQESAGRRSGYASPVPTRPTIPSLTISNGWGTPPVSTPTPITSAVNNAQSGTMSPAALVEKEIEIQKMRELIAQREQRRLQKIATAKANAETSTSTSAEGVSVKREAMPTSIPTGNISSLPDRSGISASQPPQLLDQPATGSVNVSSSSSSSAPAYATAPIDFVICDDTFHTLNATEDAGTGDQVLNTVAQQKHAVISDVQEARTSANGSVDVDLSTSTQIAEIPPALVEKQSPLEDSSAAQEQHDQYYSTYDSPFKWYPLLPSRAKRLCTSSNPEPSLLSSSASTSNASSLPSSSSLSSFDSVSSSSSSSSVSCLHSMASLYPFRTDITTFILPDLRPLKLATASRLLDPFKRICQYEVPGGGVCRDEGCEDVHLSRIVGQGGGGAEPSDQDTAEYLLNTLPSKWLADSGVSQSKMSSALQQVRLKNPQVVFEERVARALVALGPPLAPQLGEVIPKGRETRREAFTFAPACLTTETADPQTH